MLCVIVSRYIANKYQKEDSDKAIQFVECLSSMAVVREEYEWIALVDRGGLFHVNDGAFNEIETRHTHLTNTAISLDAIFEVLEDSEDIQFYWAMVSVDIRASDDADELLQAVIKLWVTMRGYSLTANG